MWFVVQKVVWDSVRIHSFNMILPIGPLILNKFENWFNFQILKISLFLLWSQNARPAVFLMNFIMEMDVRTLKN
jgi:hypothetical protein